jgi:hypothetical protein
MIVMFVDLNVNGPLFVCACFQGWLNSRQVQLQSQMHQRHMYLNPWHCIDL